MPRGAKAQALLAYLAFHSNKPIQRARLIDLLWRDRDIEQGRGSLRQALSQIRRVFAADGLDILRTTRRTVMLSTDPGAIDLWDADGHILFDDNSPLLHHMPEVANGFDEWLIDTRRVVLSSQLQAAERALAETDVRLAPEKAAKLAQRVVALDPCNEPATRILMSAYEALDKLSSVKFAYEALANALADDGFDVSESTVRLYQDIRSQAEAGKKGLKPEIKKTNPPIGNIPVLRIEPLDRSQVYHQLLNLNEALVDSCLERLVQLPELSIQDARHSQDLSAAAFSLACKVTADMDRPTGHLHLTDLASSEIVWSTRQRLEPTNIYHDLTVIADIAASGVLVVVERIQQKRFAQSPDPPITAYQHYLEAKRIFFEARNAKYMHEVEQRLERAIELEPEFEPAYIHLIQSYNNARFLSEPGRDLTWGRERALELARKLLALNALHPNAHIAMAWCQIWRRNFPLAERHFDRALSLGAYEAHRLNAIGTGLIYLGHINEGAACYDQAQDRMLTEIEYQRTDHGELSYLRGDFEAALSWLDTGERHAPYRSRFWQALSFAQLGRLADAAVALERMTTAAAPNWCGEGPITAQKLVDWHLGTLPLQRSVDMNLVFDGIEKTGLTVNAANLSQVDLGERKGRT